VERQGLNHSFIHYAEHGKPVFWPGTMGSRTARNDGMRVKEKGKSECCPVMGRIGVATVPHVKTGRLPYGLSSQENM